MAGTVQDIIGESGEEAEVGAPQALRGLNGLSHRSRSSIALALLPVEVWSSMSTQAGLTLDDKRAVRSSSASLRRLANATTKKAKLDLADKQQKGTMPPGLRPYVERVYVRATANEQLSALSNRLSGVPSAAALELELAFGKHFDLHLGTVRTPFRNAGLTERVRAVQYCCRSVLGTNLFPGREVPVSAELWPAFKNPQPEAFWANLFHHSLVEVQVTVWDPVQALHSLKPALRDCDRICGTLRCLQVDYAQSSSLPMCSYTALLAGLKLPCLVHFGSNAGVAQPFQNGSIGWPQKEHLPVLQSFGGTRAPEGIFGLGRSGVHMPLTGALPFASMAALADSALGPAIRELYIQVNDFEATWEGVPAALPFRSVQGYLAVLRSVQHLSIEGCEGSQLLVRAEAINAIRGLQKLALKGVTLQGDLTGPSLMDIICSGLQTQLRTVLARPPPALASILVPHRVGAVVPRAVLGIDVPWAPEVPAVVRAFPGAPAWKISHGACFFRMHRNVHGLVTAVPCRD